jgi:hypothetical protein
MDDSPIAQSLNRSIAQYQIAQSPNHPIVNPLPQSANRQSSINRSICNQPIAQ